ncbi:proteasome maturation factor Ump1 [Schizosaccharomyces japonicus yFS275]|uniref:Proteasome maturation factor Ump1 n=1 Tax=Schizosaccharomyces japonicus (strain yFS275 / FY16936) TaxID=402676 RepID=B6K6F9_SCHJY|nr:proteasome maturation factor Ump1 [Schizosaccharomyces japonicus yFS275]EEB09113.1 proteasome maturation factor Ump1 [Schizosaccharomyces japonicus yFS275]
MESNASTISGNYKASVFEPITPVVNSVEGKHPLEQRLAGWEQKETQKRLGMMRRIYGIHEPVRREIENKFASQDFRPLALGGPTLLHQEILAGKEASVDETDIFVTPAPMEMTLQNEMSLRYGF